MYPSKNNNTLNRLFVVGVVLLVGLLALIANSSIHTRNTTGTVSITTFATDTAISISQNDTNAELVGHGSAELRLAPGSYIVTARNNEHSATGRVTVQAKKHTKLYLPDNQPPVVPSPDDITFTGMDEITNHGLTADQTYNLRNLFFAYKQRAKTVQINTGSIAQAPHNPDSNDPFVLNFNVTIDSTVYSASISYTDLQNVELTLRDSTGATVFNQASA